jgi:hypothetical protein
MRHSCRACRNWAGQSVATRGSTFAGAQAAMPAGCANTPRIGLAALPQTKAGKGSGVLNSCSFLGGTVRVTGGGIVFGLAGFGGVLVLVGLSALVGAGVSLRLRAV